MMQEVQQLWPYIFTTMYLDYYQWDPPKLVQRILFRMELHILLETTILALTSQQISFTYHLLLCFYGS